MAGLGLATFWGFLCLCVDPDSPSVLGKLAYIAGDVIPRGALYDCASLPARF